MRFLFSDYSYLYNSRRADPPGSVAHASSTISNLPTDSALTNNSDIGKLSYVLSLPIVLFFIDLVLQKAFNIFMRGSIRATQMCLIPLYLYSL